VLLINLLSVCYWANVIIILIIIHVDVQPVVSTEGRSVSMDFDVRENWGLYWNMHWLSQCPVVSNAVWFTLSGRLRIWNQVQ